MDAQKLEETYIVESIEVFKFDKELKYFVKWLNYPASMNSFETFETLKSVTAFRAYVDRWYKSLEPDIELNNEEMEQKLDVQIREMLDKPKAFVMQKCFKTHEYEFKAYQVAYHLVDLTKEFEAKYSSLFVFNHVMQLYKKQEMALRKLLVGIRKKENIIVGIENEIDFSYPGEFCYILRNIFHEDIATEMETDSSTQLNEVSENDREAKVSSNTALKIFKKELCGWGIKAIDAITQGTRIVECVGDVRSSDRGADKGSFVFPVNLSYGDQPFIIDASASGNLSRFVNHSCGPNSHIVRIPSDDGTLEANKLVIVALEDIAEDEEITIDYTRSRTRLESRKNAAVDMNIARCSTHLS